MNIRRGLVPAFNYSMEHSSPLAAMQPPSVLFGHCFRSDAPTSYPSFGPNSFNFKDLSMKKSHPDYFSMKQVRGSSPSASLAADLSQNFHIDQRLVPPSIVSIFGRTKKRPSAYPKPVRSLLRHEDHCSPRICFDPEMDVVRYCVWWRFSPLICS